MNETQTGAQHVTQLKRYVGIAITQRLVETRQVAQRQPIDEQWNESHLHGFLAGTVLCTNPKGRMIDDVLQCVMLSLSLPRLVQLKLVDRQWRRVARRVLTSDEWLYIGIERMGHHRYIRFGNGLKERCEQYLFTDDNLRGNLLSMRQAVACQWNAIQLPCRVEIVLEVCEDRMEFGILEDLVVDGDLHIRSIVLSLRDMRFVAPQHIQDEFLPGQEEYGDLDWWILDGLYPLVPDSKRHWLHPNRSTLECHLKDKSRPVRRSTGEDVRV